MALEQYITETMRLAVSTVAVIVAVTLVVSALVWCVAAWSSLR
jgi:hypothetical protein